MYCFRKPFTAVSYEGLLFLGLPYKSSLVIMQVFGYMCAKFWGIKFIAELRPVNRLALIVGLIGFSELALFFFAVLPTDFKPLALFFNGFPLGLIWGLVFSFIEGRRNTEFLGSFMAISFIISSGVSKGLAKLLMSTYNIGDFWMPFCTGLSVFPALLFSVYLLKLIPEPNELDIKSRCERNPMNAAQRRELFSKYAVGLSLLIFMYVVLNILRDFRDNFIVELWAGLGLSASPALLSSSEIPIMLFVLTVTSSTALIKNNYSAFVADQFLIALSAAIILASTVLFRIKLIGPVYWMIIVGCGMYLGYIIFQCIIFERFIAAFKVGGNIGFLMYLADSFGYFGSISTLLYREFFFVKLNWLDFFLEMCLLFSVLILVLIMCSLLYFKKKRQSSRYFK